MSQTIESVDTLIQQRRASKKNLRNKRIIKLLLLIILHVSIGSAIYVYVTQGISKLTRIEIVGNHNLTRQEIEGMIPNREMTGFLNYGFSLSRNLQASDLVKTIELNFTQLNTLKILIEEYRPIAQMELNQTYLLENGNTVTIHTSQLNELPLLLGYSQSELETVSVALSRLKPETLVMMSSIIKNPMSYDPLYTKITMQDGITVASSLKSITVLDDYLEIKQALNPEHQCIAIDETQGVPYSFPCD